MREVTIKIWDDLAFARDETRIEAAVTASVGLDGSWRELDLSEASHAELKKILQPYLDAGRIPASSPKPADPVRARRSTPQFAYMEGMREFARENGFKYITTTGKYYYQVRLRKAYADYLEKQEREK